jgi:hypothetical protein
MPQHPQRGFTTEGMSLDELMEAVDSHQMQAHRGADTWDLINLAIQHRVAKAQERWAKVAASASVASVLVAVGAVVVAALK